ncbi:AMP-dependent synthetase/ligase [Chitinophaga sp. GCM10012297]|uniref:Long-chain fatty acid--CoA ligase n=1 Tax=Chitinophaga chungangae TaxID=2821488 RepID=A0ABS3YFD2_9BACT|nr:long-chain fatty acid--CoA ligase [Chitinophaga chungangae]MBO9153364.1 long-chain fatty acid--CoA ligase [Chitinophaga chungangae]
MHQPTRLFDVIQHQLANYSKQDMLAAKEQGTWKTYSTEDVAGIVQRFSSGLLQLGIGGTGLQPETQDKIAIISHNRPEWIFTDLACQQVGAVLVPIYPTISETELVYVLNDAEAHILFVDDIHLYEKVLANRGKLSTVKEIYSFERIAGVKHWMDILAAASTTDVARIEGIKKNITPDTLVTIIYTSGTTGIPKGVMLSHGNIMSNVTACIPILPVNEQARALSFLPLNHIFERMVTYVYFTAGVSVYYAESMEAISDNLKEVKPSIFTTVPRLLEKVYEKIMARGNTLTGIQRTMFFWALDLGNRYELNKQQGPLYNLQLAIARRLVFSKWKEAMGGQLECIVTGAAAAQVRLLRIFTAAGFSILEGYGLTETSPVIAVNGKDPKDRMFGTVGPPIDNVQVKIAGDGEILVKGPNITMGYYKNPGLTAESIREGWFHTGDVGMLVKDKFLKITDRKKELFKTSGGKFVAPQPIENKFKESPYIEQIMVVGADRKFAGALIVPNFANLQDWARTNNVAFPSREQGLKDPKVRALYKQAVDKYNQYFNHIEQVKKFELMPGEWTVDGGELTPTLKLKRKVIENKYQAAIAHIYA